ncbi:MAG: cobaltochelatase CobN subunit [Deltaproteobacteria bacterium]|nr:cobaltochelatase CobN subunit [Deltaproteobacteria bacterium]
MSCFPDCRRRRLADLLVLSALVLAVPPACVMVERGERSSTLMLKGTYRMQDKNLDAADQTYAKIGEHDPEYVPALVQRGLITAMRGDIEGGLAIMKRAEAVNPNKFDKPKNRAYNAVYQRHLTQAHIEVSDPQLVLAGGGFVVNIDRDARATVFDETSGKPVWSQSLTSGSEESLIAGGVLITVTHEGKHRDVTAFTLASGQVIWRVPLTSRELVPLAADATTVYIGDALEERGQRAGYHIRAFELATGTPRWTTPLESRPGPLGLGDGRLVLRTHDGVVHALRAADGAPLWHVTLPPQVEDQPDRIVVARDMAFVATASGALYALDATERVYDRPLERVRWQTPATRFRDGRSTPAVIGDLVVIIDERGFVGLELTTGTPRWERALPIRREGYSCEAHGDVVIGHLEGGVVAIERSGKLRWIFQEASTLGGWDSWSPGYRRPAVTDAGVWVDVNSNSSHALHRLAFAPKVPY